MSHEELTRKLSEKTGIDLSLAYDTLEKSSWSILDAIITLERNGIIPPITASASTSPHTDGYEEVLPTASEKASKRKKENKRQ